MALVLADPFQTFDTLPAFSTSGTFSIETVDGYTALRFNAAGAGQAIYKGQAADGTPNAEWGLTTAYKAVYFRFHAIPSANTAALNVVNSAGGLIARLVVLTTRAVRMDYANVSNAATAVGTSSVFALDSWHLLEMKMSDIGNAGNSVMEFRVDGAVVATSTSLTVRSSGRTIDHVTFDVANTNDYAFRTPLVDDAAYPGPCAVQVLVPNATGAFGAWTGGTGTSSFGEVDEVDGSHANDGDTTYIKSTTGGDLQAHNLSDISGTIGTVKALVPFFICRDEGGASSMDGGLRSNGFASMTGTADPGSTYVYRAKIVPLNPDGSVAWTTTTINAVQVIVENNNSVAVRVSAMGVFAIYQLGATATGALTLPHLTASGAGKQIQKATAGLSLPRLVASATGVMLPKAAAALSLPHLTAAATGKQAQTATSALTLPHLTALATGVMQPKATAALTLPHLTLAAAANAEVFAPEGTSALTLPRLVASATGVMLPKAAAALSLPHLTAAASGVQSMKATAALALPRLAASATGVMKPSATAALSLPRLTLAAVGVMRPKGTAALLLPFLRFVAAASHHGTVHGATPPEGFGNFRRLPPAGFGAFRRKPPEGHGKGRMQPPAGS